MIENDTTGFGMDAPVAFCRVGSFDSLNAQVRTTVQPTLLMKRRVSSTNLVSPWVILSCGLHSGCGKIVAKHSRK